MSIRLRIPELLEAADLTAWGLHRRSGGRISASTAYRLVQFRGELANFPAATIEALCDVLGVTPGDLFERDKPTKGRSKAKKAE